MKKILVLGSSNMDFVVQLDRMPEIGETIISKDFHRIPGGKGANQAYACGKLGGSTCFLSAVGSDGIGSIIVDNLQQAGVDCSQVAFCDGQSTGMAMIYVNSKGDNSIVVVPGANNACDREYLAACEHLLASSDIVVAQLEIPLEGVCYAMGRAHELGKLTILNPAPAPECLPQELYSCLDYITPNETELHLLTGRGTDSLDEIRAAADILLERGVKNVVVTLGNRGALLRNSSTCIRYPAPRVCAVDTTAAGDTFNGALAVRLAEGAVLEDAINFANAAAALAVTIRGAQTSVPFRDEVERFLQNLQGNAV